MEQSEFDKFAEEYNAMHAKNIRASGEAPEYFAEYKILDTIKLIHKHQLQLQENLEILDFGAGIGGSIPYFKKYLPKATVTCIDVSNRSLEIGRKRFSHQAKFVHFDGLSIPYPDNSFHVVFVACVFHHIKHEKREKLLTEIKRILKPSGFLIIFEHNPLNPLTVRAVNTCPFDENAELIRAGIMMDLIKRAGYSGAGCSYRIFFPRFLSKLRIFESLLRKVPFGAQYYVMAKKIS